MKLRSLIAVLLCFVAGQTQAQEGFKIGPSAAFISSRAHVIDSLPNHYNFRFKSGFRFGLAAQYGFSPTFVLGTGLNFSNKGYRVYNDTNSGENLLKHNFSNIELPVNMIFKFRMGASSRMRFLLGATLNYQISNAEKTLVNDNETFVIREEYKQKVYPMTNLGVEIASENKAGNIFVFGIYYHQSFSEQSLLRVYNSKNAASERFSLGYRGSYIGLGLTYLFDVKNLKSEEVFFY